MTVWRRCLGWSAVVGCLSACSVLDVRDARFEQPAAPPHDTLVLIGGNSECGGDKGLWKVKEKVRNDIALRLGSGRALATIYYAWTGDDPKRGSCLPNDLLTYQHGEERIFDEIRRKNLLSGGRLIVVGWSNGGKTADELSALVRQRLGPRRVDLLVTLDPVSRLTGGPVRSEATTWLNVYVRSVGLQRFLNAGNIIAWIGGAWNDFDAPALDPAVELNDCIQGNHGDVLPMWDTVLRSTAFARWLARVNPDFDEARARKDNRWREPTQTPACRSNQVG